MEGKYIFKMWRFFYPGTDREIFRQYNKDYLKTKMPKRETNKLLKLNTKQYKSTTKPLRGSLGKPCQSQSRSVEYLRG